MPVDIEETNIGAHAILVTPDGKIALQQRDNNLGIVNPGLITVFGGTLRSSDNLDEGLKSELMEELELDITNYEVSKLGAYHKTKEIDGVDFVINVFIVKDVSIENLKLHEGKNIYCDFAENVINNPKLTRICKLAVADYIKLIRNIR
jgi:8-oxo-dGTP pyrophosphatase MutT (NUDIX family)